MSAIEAFEVSILAVFVVVNSAIVVVVFTRAFTRIIARHLADRRLSQAAGLEKSVTRGVRTRSEATVQFAFGHPESSVVHMTQGDQRTGSEPCQWPLAAFRACALETAARHGERKRTAAENKSIQTPPIPIP